MENSKAYSLVSGWAAGHLKKALAIVFANEVQLARARLTQQVQRRLAQLPEHRRTYAEQKVERVLSALYGEKEERVEIVVAVALDAIEQDAYFDVVKSINEAKDDDDARLAHALGEFGLIDMAVIGEQSRRRLEILDQLDALAANPATREVEMHVALEHNLMGARR